MADDEQAGNGSGNRIDASDVTWPSVTGDGVFLIIYSKEIERPAWQRRFSWMVRRWRGPIVTYGAEVRRFGRRPLMPGNVEVTIFRSEEEFYANFIRIDAGDQAVLVFNFGPEDVDLARQIAGLMAAGRPIKWDDERRPSDEKVDDAER